MIKDRFRHCAQGVRKQYYVNQHFLRIRVKEAGVISDILIIVLAHEKKAFIRNLG